MITRPMEREITPQSDFITAKKLCRGVFGFEPEFLQHTTSSARRNLFASADDPELENSNSSKIVCQLLADATEEMSVRASETWSFDFLTETPLEGGRYKWERVCTADVPHWYARGTPVPAEKYCGGKVDSVLVPVCTNSANGKERCNRKPKLVQSSIKSWACRVQKQQCRSSTRLRLKKLDIPASRITHYILRGPAKSS